MNDNPKQSRDKRHKTETKTQLIFASAITDFSSKELSMKDGDLVFRKPDERDYGVDGEVEIFEDGRITGRLARVQLKGTEKVIERLKTADYVSCPNVSKASLEYCRAKNIPFILVYISKADKKFYYSDMQPVYENILARTGDRNFSVTVRLPIENNSDDLSRLVHIINKYYEASGEKKIVGIRTENSLSGHADSADQKISMEKSDKNGSGSTWTGTEDNLWDAPYDVTTYIVEDGQTPADGEHKMVDSQGDTVAIGCWRHGRLEKGTEYNHLIRVTAGGLIFNPGNPKEPYDATDDFEYEKLEMYHWETFSPFRWSESCIAEVGFDKCYVVDMEVDGGMEQMIHIRTLEDFLAGKNPQYLRRFKEIIMSCRDEMFDRSDVMEEEGDVGSRIEHQMEGQGQAMEALLRERNARLMDQNGSVTDVPYKALDLLQMFMESNYGQGDCDGISAALSRKVLENKPEKEMCWKYATVANAIPGNIEKTKIQELVNVLRAYEFIDCDKAGFFFVTERGRKAADDGLIALDLAKMN